MKPFTRVHSAARYEAIYEARFARKLSYRRIAKLAKDGDLVPDDQFAISAEYIGSLCRKEEAKRSGRMETALADKPHKDACEVLRRRMVSAADALSRHYSDLAAKHPEKADPVRGRQIMAMVREARAMPEAKDAQPPAPGQERDGQRHGEKTRTGPGGKLLEASRRTSTHDQAPYHSPDQAEPPADTSTDGMEGEGTGSLMRAQSATRAA